MFSKEELNRLNELDVQSVRLLVEVNGILYYEGFAGAEILLVVNAPSKVPFICNLGRAFREGIIKSNQELLKWYRSIPFHSIDRWDYICKADGHQQTKE